MESFIYTTEKGATFVRAANQLDALRKIIKREALNGYIGGAVMYTEAAWMRMRGLI